jgi:hypothetical protein
MRKAVCVYFACHPERKRRICLRRMRFFAALRMTALYIHQTKKNCFYAFKGILAVGVLHWFFNQFKASDGCFVVRLDKEVMFTKTDVSSLQNGLLSCPPRLAEIKFSNISNFKVGGRRYFCNNLVFFSSYKSRTQGSIGC